MVWAAMIAPLTPFLLLQGQITRWKVGVLPDAARRKARQIRRRRRRGQTFRDWRIDRCRSGSPYSRTCTRRAICRQLSEQIDRPVDWKVIGKNGVTAQRTIDELLPHMPDESFDYILVGLGGNDVMKALKPGQMAARYDRIARTVSNEKSRRCHLSLQLPDDRRFADNAAADQDYTCGHCRRCTMTISRNLREKWIVSFIIRSRSTLGFDGFFADGLHPSEQGYTDWAAAMMKYFSENHKW